MSAFFAASWTLMLDPMALGLFFSACLLGLFFGAIPGLSGMTVAVLALPFTVYLSTGHAIMFYGVVYVTGVYGGAVTAILFNIPGSVENAPATLDGYPMTLRGQADRAVGLAISASAIGGAIACIVMMASSTLIAQWAVAYIGPVEKFALIVFALSSVASLSNAPFARSWLSLFLGLFLAVIGTDPVGGHARYAFDSLYLMGGINAVALMLGFFAVSEVLNQSARVLALAERQRFLAAKLPRIFALWRLRITLFCATAIGFFCGVLPGVGSALASFLSYSITARWSRSETPFGEGAVKGLVAAEAANNAATAGAMIPLLCLGFPGGAYTAIMLTVFILHGLTPGPLILLEQHALVWLLFSAMFWASVLILILGLIESRLVVRLLRIPFAILGPCVLLFATLGAYSLRHNMLDIWTLFIAGFAGYFLKRFGYSLPMIVMGFILGGLAETAFYQTMVLIDYSILTLLSQPLACIFLLLSALNLLLGLYRSF